MQSLFAQVFTLSSIPLRHSVLLKLFKVLLIMVFRLFIMYIILSILDL